MEFSVVASPFVEAGIQRGGEDLFIKFSAKTTTRPDLSNLDFQIDLDNEWSIDGDQISFKTEYYDFGWNGTKDDLRKMVMGAIIKESHWNSNLAGTEFRFEYEEFVDGNAE